MTFVRAFVIAVIVVAGGTIAASAEDGGSDGASLLFDGTFEFSGFVGIESRFFAYSPEFGQDPQRVQPSAMLQGEARYEFNDGNDLLTLIPYARLDDVDGRRTHFDLREANWQHLADDWDLVIGLGKVFWGKTEARHLVDIINQTDYVDDSDAEQKLGQPMINLNLHRDWGSLALFVLPGFREPEWPGRNGRLRTALPVSVHDPEPIYESGAEDHHVDFAGRWTHTLGDWDLGLSRFHGTSREPRLNVAFDQGGRLVLQQSFDIIDQTGVDIQATKGTWLWKFEGISRWSGQADSHFLAAVGGFEYTIFDLFETGSDLGLLLEYLYDGRNSGAPQTAAQDDVFAGARVTLNDVQDTSSPVNKPLFPLFALSMRG